jgi:lysophospholipid acyltransferase (LPLAT)-like uncharacterized protein
MRRLRGVVGWILARLIVAWSWSCRTRVVNDPRPALRASNTPYVYALLHAHALAAVCVNDERPGGIAAMVSRSADGDVLAPALHARGVLAVRGSTRTGRRDKGGREALEALRKQLEARVAPLLAVDGPRGPRGVVRRGVADLAMQVRGAVVLPTVVVSSHRLVVPSWDRFQVPLPFCRLSLIFGEPLLSEPGERAKAFSRRVEIALHALECESDPEEFARVQGS